MNDTKGLYDNLIKSLLEEIGPDNDCPAAAGTMQKEMPGHSLLILVSGGLTGAQEAAEQLQALKAAGYRMEVLFTQAAERVLGAKWLKSCGLGEAEVLNGMADGFVALGNADAVVVPVMTVNTASKVLNGIADNAVTTGIMHALLQGKPVIAARDACDVANLTNVRKVKKPLYYATLAANPVCLEQFGIDLVPASGLKAAVEAACKPEDLLKEIVVSEPAEKSHPAEETAGTETKNKIFTFTGRVLSLTDVLTCRADVIQISKRVLVTPAAFDKASERKIKIEVV